MYFVLIDTIYSIVFPEMFHVFDLNGLVKLE